MYRWLWVVVSLCSAIVCVEARSSTVNIAETVYYDFTFELASGSIGISHDWALGLEPPYSATESPGSGQYDPVFSFGFFHYGHSILDLEGTTLDLASLFSAAPPSPIEVAYYASHVDNYMDPKGSVTFGPGNAITRWDFAAVINQAAEATSKHWSDARYGVGIIGLLEDPAPYLDRAIYGEINWPALSTEYFTNPGRWSTAVSCQTGDGQTVPCLNPVPLPSTLALLATWLVGLLICRRMSIVSQA